MIDIDCPICCGNYHDVDCCGDVCEKHQDTWIITKCSYCNKCSYSQDESVCPYCASSYARLGHGGSSKDRRASLRNSGMESW